jgi:hypothetical protein
MKLPEDGPTCRLKHVATNRSKSNMRSTDLFRIYCCVDGQIRSIWSVTLKCSMITLKEMKKVLEQFL